MKRRKGIRGSSLLWMGLQAAVASPVTAATKGRVVAALGSDTSTMDPHMHTERVGIIINQHLFHTQAVITVEHLVHKIDHMRAQHGRGNAHSTGEVGGDNFVRPGAARLVGVANVMQAGYHPGLGVEQLDGQGHHQVVAVVGRDGKHTSR